MKRLSEPEPRRVQDGEEWRGPLLRVLELEGQCVATFSFGSCLLPIELAAQLRELVGKRVGIIHLDGQHRVRALR